MMAQSQRIGKDDDDDSEMFMPPSNDFFNRAAKLSVWSGSIADVLMVDGNSSDPSDSDDVSIKRLSDNDSFGKSQRSHTNSIAGMSRGSMSSTGSKGIRNLLGGKFAKRANSINKVETKAKKGPGYMVPGQSKPMGYVKDELRDNTILEDMDSDIDNSLSEDALNYNYDVINLKEETSPFHNPVKDVLTIFYKRLGEEDDEENDPTRVLQSRTLLAVDIQIYMKLGAAP